MYSDTSSSPVRAWADASTWIEKPSRTMMSDLDTVWYHCIPAHPQRVAGVSELTGRCSYVSVTELRLETTGVRTS
ncbi:hypothetical protein BDK88_3110 [Natrinema hispanicum]|uniref:Uncharacterized protein n=1 Tax=Natrinema hispanicum TaxID=392421 RepID=A0A482Y9J2_9EURY|nr:hypothetical protein BDK88_3110 [Natrinema hispanicum]